MTTTTVPEWTLGDRLAKARNAARISVEQMAAELGVSRNTVTNYEHDKTPAKRAVVRTYAATTGVPLEWLEGGPTVTVGYPLPTLRRHRRPVAA